MTHYQRGLNFVNMLQNISGGSLPANATVDFVEGVTHDCEGMTRSPSGLTRVCVRFSRAHCVCLPIFHLILAIREDG